MTGKFVILPADRRPGYCKTPTLDASKGDGTLLFIDSAGDAPA